MSYGWVSIHRQIREHWVWEEKPFSYGQAWIDMIMMANHADNKVPIGKEIVIVETGSFITSEPKLSERWGWSRTKVRTFLSLLEQDKMIIKKSDRKKTTVTIVNYSAFQILETTEKQLKNNKKTTEKQLKNTNNNDNNVNNENNNIINYQEIIDMYSAICVSYPKVRTLSDKRKAAIKARSKKYTLEDFRTLFTMAEESDFMKGQNDRNWMADLDWMLKDGNMAKVLEGKYKNRTNNVKKAEQPKDDYDELEKMILGVK